MVAALPTLHRSSYRVSWETLSSDDLHRTSGVLVFGVGQAVTAGGLDEPAPPPLEAALRWLVLVGLSGALGGALALHLLAPASAVGAPHTGRRVGRGARAAVLRGRCGRRRRRSPRPAGHPARPRRQPRAAAAVEHATGCAGGCASSACWCCSVRRWPGRGSPGPRAGWAPLAAGAALACVGTALLGHSGTGRSPDPTRVLASAAAPRRGGDLGGVPGRPRRGARRRSCAGTRRPGSRRVRCCSGSARRPRSASP